MGFIELPQTQKHKIYEMLEETKIKCRKLENENKELNDKINTLTQDYEKQLYEQRNIFKDIIKKEKEKISLKRKKMNVISKKSNRKLDKLNSLMNKLKNSKVISDETYDILNSSVGNVSYKILRNDHENKNKQQGRRYSEDVKRFALTLHYHSPKAYEYCRLKCFPTFL